MEQSRSKRDERGADLDAQRLESLVSEKRQDTIGHGNTPSHRCECAHGNSHWACCSPIASRLRFAADFPTKSAISSTAQTSNDPVGTVALTFRLDAVTPTAGVPSVGTVTFEGTGQATVANTLAARRNWGFMFKLSTHDNRSAMAPQTSTCTAYRRLPILVVREPSQHAGLPNVLGYRIAFSHGTERQFFGPTGTSFPAVCTATQNMASPLARQQAQVGITQTAYIITFNCDHSRLTYKSPLDSTYSQRRAFPDPRP